MTYDEANETVKAMVVEAKAQAVQFGIKPHAVDSFALGVFMSKLTDALSSSLVERIKGALDTEEDGDALVQVARDACRAERRLANLESAARDE
jgi:hypothetical protein